MIQELTKEQYTALLSHFSDYHFIQSTESDYQDILYGNTTHISFSAEPSVNEPIILLKFGVTAIFQNQKIALGSFGPILNLSKVDDKVFEEFTSELMIFLKEKDITYLQIYPVLLNDRNQEIENLLAKNKYLHKSPKKFTWLDGTMIVDLNQDIEEMFRNLRKDVRANIKKAEKDSSLSIKTIENIEKQDIDAFFELYQKQQERKSFTDRAVPFYRTLMENNKAVLFNAFLDNKFVSSILAIKYDSRETLITYLSASTGEAFRHEAPTLLRWKLINWAKENGYKQVDFFSLDKSTPSVSRFKLGFRPQVIEFPINAYDLVVKPELYYPYQFYSSGKRILNGIEVFAKGLLKNHK